MSAYVSLKRSSNIHYSFLFSFTRLTVALSLSFFLSLYLSIFITYFHIFCSSLYGWLITRTIRCNLFDAHAHHYITKTDLEEEYQIKKKKEKRIKLTTNTKSILLHAVTFNSTKSNEINTYVYIVYIYGPEYIKRISFYFFLDCIDQFANDSNFIYGIQM